MRNTLNYSEIEQEIVKQHNILRQDPSSYIHKLQDCLNYFRDKIYHIPGEDPIITSEGKEAVEEAIAFLKEQKPLPPGIYSQEISKACQDHVTDIGPKGGTTHDGSDGKTICDRIEKYCEWDGACAENGDFGFKSPENIMINGGVDDGVTGRFQRKNVFHPDGKYIGVGVGPHKDYNICVALGYIHGIRQLGEEAQDVEDFIKDYIKNTNGKIAKNPFQEEDPDAPDDTKSMQVGKLNKIINGEKRKITKKIYTGSNGSQHIVEIQES